MLQCKNIYVYDYKNYKRSKPQTINALINRNKISKILRKSTQNIIFTIRQVEYIYIYYKINTCLFNSAYYKMAKNII